MPEQKRSKRVGFVGVAGALIAMALVFSWLDGGSDAKDQQGLARIACEGWVKDKLNAPDASISQQAVTGSGPWTVTGMIDSQPWSCKAYRDGDTMRGSTTVG